jgi:cytochrome c biogenesis factor
MNPEDVQPQRTQVSARIRVDGGQVYEPALNQFPNATQTIGTPSVRVGATEDVYLTLVAAPAREGGPVVLGVIIEPLASWLWVGGGIMGFGTLLAAWPTARGRREDDPVASAEGGRPAAAHLPQVEDDGAGRDDVPVPSGVG